MFRIVVLVKKGNLPRTVWQRGKLLMYVTLTPLSLPSVVHIFEFGYQNVPNFVHGHKHPKDNYGHQHKTTVLLQLARLDCTFIFPSPSSTFLKYCPWMRQKMNGKWCKIRGKHACRISVTTFLHYPILCQTQSLRRRQWPMLIYLNYLVNYYRSVENWNGDMNT